MGKEDISAELKADVEMLRRIPIISSLLDVVCRTTGMGFAAIARVTETKWVACSVKDDIQFGLKPGEELVLETTICNEIRQSGKAVIINDVAADPAFANHHTPLQYGFKSYISVPITLQDGTFFGTLCAIDPRPALLNRPEITNMFYLFAELISFHLQAADRLASSEKNLSEAKETAELREQFIAVLGHDLRSPLTAVSNSAQLLQRMPLSADGKRLAGLIKDSSYRMKGLIENVLDFARGRMGGGVNINSRTEAHLQKVLAGVIDELQVIYPNTVINASYEITQPITCDPGRIAQLFSNLLGNALSYGLQGTPVKVEAVTRNNEFTLLVSNQGPRISERVMERLFKPFARGEVERRQQGLGLGLYIAFEIAKAHAGTIKAMSTIDETVFVFCMPCGSTAA